MNIDNLLKRIEIFLSEGNFRAAKEYCERVLDEDVENAQAYIFALMIELKLTDIDMLKYVSVNLNNYPNFVKALKYGNFEQKNYLTACRDTVLYKIEKKQKETERASLQESLDNDKLMLAELEIERNRIADYLLVFDKLYKSLNIVAFVWYLLVGFMICSIVLTVQNNNFLIMLIISIISVIFVNNVWFYIDTDIFYDNELKIEKWMFDHSSVQMSEAEINSNKKKFKYINSYELETKISLKRYLQYIFIGIFLFVITIFTQLLALLFDRKKTTKGKINSFLSDIEQNMEILQKNILEYTAKLAEFDDDECVKTYG